MSKSIKLALVPVVCGLVALMLSIASINYAHADAGVGSAAVSSVEPSPVVPDPSVDADGFLRAIYDAATSGKWKVFAGLFLVGLVFATRKWIFGRVDWFQTRVGGIVLGLGLSLGTTFGVALASGAKVTIGVVLSAIGTAVTAAGLWQWLQGKTKP